MGGRKSLIPFLKFLTISYHITMLMTVITDNPSIIRPSIVTSWATIYVLWFS